MAKNTGGKGFWKKGKAQNEPELNAPEVIDFPTTEGIIEMLPELETEAEEILPPSPPVVQEEETPSQPLSVLPSHSETLADAAARLAAEEAEKRTYARAAVEEAQRAEAAFRRVEKEAALKQAEAKAQSIQMVSVKAQQDAANALQELSRVEQAHIISVKEAEQKAAEEAAVQARIQKETADQQAENQLRITTAQNALDALTEQIVNRQLAMEQAKESRSQAELELENTEAELLRIQNEGNELLRKMNRSLDEAQSEAAVISRQIAVLEERIHSEQYSYDAASSRVKELESKLPQMEQRVAELVRKQEEIKAQSEEALSLSEEASNNRLERTRQQAADAEQHFKNAQAHEVQSNEELNMLQKQHEDSEQALRNLGLEKEEYERQTRERLEAVLVRIDQAKEAVTRKKDQYQEAQKRVESATTELVRVNALAKTAQEKLSKAQAEEDDAKMAFTMAQKLRSDALAARSNTDEASSQLLSKAESVLLATIDSTNVLLAEKTAARQEAEQEANYHQELAETATAASNKATAAANDMIVIWLAAEESFVKTTSDVEAEKARLEVQLENTLEEYEDKQKALTAQVESLAEQVRKARQQAETSVLATKEAQQQLHMLQTRLDVANADQKDELSRLHKEWEERLYELAQDVERAQATESQCQDELDQAKAEQERQAVSLGKKLEVFRNERKELQDKLDEKNAVVDSCRQESNEKELDFKSQLQATNEQIQRLTEDIQTYNETISNAETRIRELQKAQTEAQEDLEKIEKSCEDELNTLEQTHQGILAPISEARLTAEERTVALAERLSQCRSLAEKAVRLAAQSFTERLTAVSTVSICKTENQIAILKENALPLQKAAAEEKAILDAAERIYLELNEKVVLLRAEEERINNEADTKYHQLEQSANDKLEELEAKLKEVSAEAEAKTSAAAQAKQKLDTANLQLEDARKRATEAAASRDDAIATADKRLQKLKDEYFRQLADASVNLPKLLEESNVAAAAVTEQQVATDEAEEACRRQSEVVDDCLQQELTAPQRLAEAVEALRSEKQAALNKAQTELSALEEKQRSLQASYEESCDIAEKSELAKANVENYLNERLGQQEKEQSEAELRIKEIEDRLAQLKEDATVKERAYREAEKMLADSSSLLQNASSAYSDAQVSAAKAQAELQSSQAAKETATALAQQASVVRDGMDKSTADILMKAAEGLFAAVETAEAVIVEKQAAYDLAAETLQNAQTELDRVRTAIGAAPAQLEQCRNQWELAEREYRELRKEADEKIPGIRKALDDFIAQRKADMTAAEEALRNCQAEATLNQASVEKLNRQLMELAAEISARASEVQTIQLEMADEIAAMELESSHQQASKKEERLAAQELATRLNVNLVEHRDRLARLRQEALEKKDVHRKADREYQRFEAELTARYQDDQQSACDLRDGAMRAAQAALEALNAASKQQEICINDYEEAQRLQALASANRQDLASECAALRRNRDASLKTAAEEKLRLLGMKTIERIKAEDEVSKALSDCQAKQSRCRLAEQKATEIENAIRVEEDKLARIRQESEETLRIARTKTSIFA